MSLLRARKSEPTKLDAGVTPSTKPARDDGTATSPTLLGHVSDWTNHKAWIAFHNRYDPMLRQWCRRYDLDADTTDELCQRIWVELMVKMRIFHYDPSRRFRGWLFRLFSSRAIDLLRKRTTKDALATRSLNDIDCLAIVGESADPDFEYAFDEAELLALIQISEQVRDRVRARVSTENWTAFELIALRDQSIKDVSQLLGKSYTATYTAYRRVDRLLREEGRKQLASGSVVTTPTDALLMGSHARPRSPRTSADRF